MSDEKKTAKDIVREYREEQEAPKVSLYFDGTRLQPLLIINGKSIGAVRRMSLAPTTSSTLAVSGLEVDRLSRWTGVGTQEQDIPASMKHLVKLDPPTPVSRFNEEDPTKR